MKTVLRQEWNASKKRIVTVSVVLAGIMTFCIFINVLTYYLNTKHVFGFGILLYILCFFIGTSGVVLFSLIKGSGNLHSVLFKETNYLMLTIPKRSWVLMGGKILMNLFEFIIYAIPTAFYLSFLGPVGEFFIQKIVLNGKTVNEGFTIAHSYWGNVKQLYHAVFVTGLGHTIQVIVFVVSMFVVVQIFLNMAFAIYAAFIKLKKKHFILMAIIIYFSFYIPIRISTYIGISLNEKLSSHAEWGFLGAIIICAAVYYLLTAWLIEKKIEV